MPDERNKLMAFANVIKRLDIKGQTVRNPLDMVDILQGGLFAKTVEILEEYLSIKSREMAHLLSVSERTIDRYKVDCKKKLNPAISERIFRIAMVKDKCDEVFGDPDLCAEWLTSENMAMGGKSPLELMKFDLGIDLVIKELGRIEHGIVS